MWAEIRLVVTGLAFLARLFRRGAGPRAAGALSDGSVLYVRPTAWNGRPASTGIAWPHAGAFVIERRSVWHALLQRAGLARGSGIGDAGFDAVVWLAEDAGSLRAHLQHDQATRAAVVAAFADGFDRIEADRGVLWLAGRATREHDALGHLRGLRRALAPSTGTQVAATRSPWRRRLVASLAWAIGAYAAVAVLECLVESPPVHLDLGALVGMGLVLGALGLALFVVACTLLLGRATRRGLAGVLPWLALVAPVAGIQAAADLNRALDRGADVVVERTIIDRVRHAGRYAFARHVIAFDPVAASAHEPFAIPRTIGIGRSLHATIAPCDRAILTLGHGALGVPWIRAIRIVPATPAGSRTDRAFQAADCTHVAR